MYLKLTRRETLPSDHRNRSQGFGANTHCFFFSLCPLPTWPQTQVKSWEVQYSAEILKPQFSKQRTSKEAKRARKCQEDCKEEELKRVTPHSDRWTSGSLPSCACMGNPKQYSKGFHNRTKGLTTIQVPDLPQSGP